METTQRSLTIMSNDTSTPVEVVESATALESMERAQIDVQIATAKRYPRELSKVKQKMLSFATLDTETASGCFYTLPARKGGDGKPLQGPSVRLAEIAVASYGHLSAGMRIVGNDGKFITAQGVCHDLENNVRICMEVKRRITTKDGRTYSEDMQATAGNAACAIAFRNAVFKVVPLALIKPVYEAAKRTAIGDAKTLVQRRSDAMAMFAKMGVEKEKVLKTLEVRSVEDIALEHLELLIGYYNAIKDGDTTVDEVFNPKPDAPKQTLGEVIGKPEDKPATVTDKTYTAEERAAILKEVESLMLDNAVGEAKVMLHVHQEKLAKPGQDEVGTLDSTVLDALRVVIPTLKKGVK